MEKNTQRSGLKNNRRVPARLRDLTVNTGRSNNVIGGMFNAFANFGDIKGESTSTKNPGSAEVMSYSWGV